MKRKSGVSRRDFLKSSALAGAAAATAGGALTAGVVRASEKSKRKRKKGGPLVLLNGRIHTMDPGNPLVSSVAIENGRFVEVGHGARDMQGAKVIDLRGKTVVPGLIESHTHFVSLANRPGYHVAEWELASITADVLAALKARRKRGDVPVGAFITAMGAGVPNIWHERRMPTLAELDAAVPDRPVFLYQGGGGPARVNSLGMAFFATVTNPTVTVNADGTIPGGNPNQSNAALYHLRIRQSFTDKKRSCIDAQEFSASVGLTTVLDQTLVATALGTLDPTQYDPQPNHGLSTLNHYRMYDAWLALHAEGNDVIRLQINFLHNQGYIAALDRPGQPVPDLGAQLPELRERLKNQFQFHGDDMVRTGAIGEWAAPFAAPTNANGYAVWLEAQRLCAKARWRNENSQGGSPTNTDNIEQVVATYEMMHQEMIAAGFPDGIRSLRWGLQHADHATAGHLARLKALNCGVSASGFRWTGAPRADALPVGPMFPRLVESGIPLGLHQDGVHITAHNPWYAMHYASTGLNNVLSTEFPEGQQINPGQQVSRQQALHMYTVGAAWYLNREDDLGQIKEGYLADLVVLDKDYFRASNAEMRNIRPVLTVVDGKVVHDTGALDGGGHDDDDDDDDDDGGRGHGRK
ncbi:MAG TPA: amidohydrolase family protein [Burkholderiales bacterium]|nr:amidohydrolase family protein [Burkholderiales bacterium]